jgi:hypothetical protein
MLTMFIFFCQTKKSRTTTLFCHFWLDAIILTKVSYKKQTITTSQIYVFFLFVSPILRIPPTPLLISLGSVDTFGGAYSLSLVFYSATLEGSSLNQSAMWILATRLCGGCFLEERLGVAYFFILTVSEMWSWFSYFLPYTIGSRACRFHVPIMEIVYSPSGMPPPHKSLELLMLFPYKLRTLLFKLLCCNSVSLAKQTWSVCGCPGLPTI